MNALFSCSNLKSMVLLLLGAKMDICAHFYDVNASPAASVEKAKFKVLVTFTGLPEKL